MAAKKTTTKQAATKKAKAASATKPRAAKAKPEAKEKKMSALDAAAKVLGETGGPMTTKELIDAMAAKGYWTSPGGKTPERTLYSALARDVDAQRARTSNLRFRRRQAGFCNGFTGLVVASNVDDRGAHRGAREFAT